MRGGRGLVAFGRLETQQNLVVAKEIRCVQSEVLIFIFDREGECDFTLEDHVELGKVFALFNDGLVRDEDAAVQNRHEVADELIAALQSLPTKVIREEVREVNIDKLLKKFMNQLFTQLGLQLVQEVITVHKLLMVVEH